MHMLLLAVAMLYALAVSSPEYGQIELRATPSGAVLVPIMLSWCNHTVAFNC